MRPAIRDALWASRSISFWNVRISRPLESPDERFCEPGSHFQRLFSGGTAFLITEDVFADLRRTVMILCWFSSFQKNKPGAYKLFLRPDVMEYLNQRLEDPSGDKKEDHLYVSSNLHPGPVLRSDRQLTQAHLDDLLDRQGKFGQHEVPSLRTRKPQPRTAR